MSMIGAVSVALNARSQALVRSLNVGMPKILALWVILASFIAGLRAAFPVTPVASDIEKFGQILPYMLVVGAPAVTILFALQAFPSNRLYAQPAIRLANYGSWKPTDCLSARAMPIFGATGIMASLLIGMLLNIPVRSLEFMVAVPALGGEAPGWLKTLFAAMLADVVILSSLYAAAFVMALRHVPLFPRFLVAVWSLDLLAQLGIAAVVSRTEGLPADVAAQLQALLHGNLEKVLISVALWAPYLLVSDRVNLTYRHRLRTTD